MESGFQLPSSLLAEYPVDDTDVKVQVSCEVLRYVMCSKCATAPEPDPGSAFHSLGASSAPPHAAISPLTANRPSSSHVSSAQDLSKIIVESGIRMYTSPRVLPLK